MIFMLELPSTQHPPQEREPRRLFDLETIVGLSVEDLEIAPEAEEVDLEDVFLQLVGRNAHDPGAAA